jgi:hypothetical protein
MATSASTAGNICISIRPVSNCLRPRSASAPRRRPRWSTAAASPGRRAGGHLDRVPQPAHHRQVGQDQAAVGAGVGQAEHVAPVLQADAGGISEPLAKLPGRSDTDSTMAGTGRSPPRTGQQEDRCAAAGASVRFRLHDGHGLAPLLLSDGSSAATRVKRICTSVMAATIRKITVEMAAGQAELLARVLEGDAPGVADQDVGGAGRQRRCRAGRAGRR